MKPYAPALLALLLCHAGAKSDSFQEYIPAKKGPAISTGKNFAFIFHKDGLVQFLGANAYDPEFVPGLSSDALDVLKKHQFSQVYGGEDFVAAIDVNGKLWDLSSARQVSGDYREIAISSGYFVAIGLDGKLRRWGESPFNAHEEVYEENKAPRILSELLFDTIEAGDRHLLAIAKDGTLWTMGHNTFGELGDGTKKDGDILVQIGNEKYKAVAAGRCTSYALKYDGSLWAWGLNNLGQLGVPGNDEELEPVRVTDRTFVSITAGSFHALALEADGTLWGWGWNYGCRVGNGKHKDSTRVPAKIGNRKYQAVHAFGLFTVAIDKQGTIWGWGHNFLIDKLKEELKAKKTLSPEYGGWFCEHVKLGKVL